MLWVGQHEVLLGCTLALSLLHSLIAFHQRGPLPPTAWPQKHLNSLVAPVAASSSVSIICPAQFASRADYNRLCDTLGEKGIKAVPVDLRKLDWAGLAPSFFSQDYWKGTLKPSKTLGFYLNRIDETVDRILKENPDCEINIVAHSIGGWVARAWLSEWADSKVVERVRSCVTLGTPHVPPPSGVWESLDQTRGLLTYLTENFPGAHVKTIRYVSVCGDIIEGGFAGVEQLLALGSYSALCGDWKRAGDGLIPIDAAALEGAELVRVSCKHANFIPTLGPSIQIPFKWYGSEDVVDEWVGFLSDPRQI